MSHDGRQITAQEFMEQLFGDLGKMVSDEDELRRIWSAPDTRDHFMRRLTELGYDRDRLTDMQRLIDAPDSDIFDVLAYIRFSLAPITRGDRAQAVRTNALSGYESEMKDFLDYVLNAYELHGADELGQSKLPDLLRIKFGGTNDARAKLGSLGRIRDAFLCVQEDLYRL